MRNITKQSRLEEKMGLASHQPQPSTLISAPIWKPRKRLARRAQGANTPQRIVDKPLGPGDCDQGKKWNHAIKEEGKFPNKVFIGSGLCPMKVFTRHVGSWTCVQILPCPVKIFTGHKPCPYSSSLHLMHCTNSTGCINGKITLEQCLHN